MQRLSFEGLKKGEQSAAVKELQSYLTEIGYSRMSALDETVAVKANPNLPLVEPGVFDEATEMAIRRFQAYYGLQVTGLVDQATANLLAAPRCGVPDIPFDEVAEWVAQGNVWNKRNLTYSFGEWTADLSQADVRAAVQQAFGLWAAVTDLTFAEAAAGQTGDIVIRFVTGEHGDRNPFDGPGRILAHAFYPPPNAGSLAGDTHFDDAETWSITIPSPSGTFDLVSVAAHEFGHALGLMHSNILQALMYAYYKSPPQRQLANDDKEGIRAIYPIEWRAKYHQGDPGNGIGGYDFKHPADKAFAFDYDHSGRLDHLVLYRPARGAVFIVKNTNGQFTPVYQQVDPGNGIGGFDLKHPADRAFAFDYDHSGYLDHIVLYRPGRGAIYILKNNNGQFSPVYRQDDPGGGIGGFDLKSPADSAFAFDYDRSGRQDHIVIYRPGKGAIFILKNVSGVFSPVYQQIDPGNGIGGYDLLSAADQAFAIDYDHSGRLDHIVLYRPGKGAIFILKNNGGQFGPV